MTLTGYALAGEDPSVAVAPTLVAGTLLVAFFVVARRPGLLRAPARIAVGSWSGIRRRIRGRPAREPGSLHDLHDLHDQADRAADRFVASFGADQRRICRRQAPRSLIELPLQVLLRRSFRLKTLRGEKQVIVGVRGCEPDILIKEIAEAFASFFACDHVITDFKPKIVDAVSFLYQGRGRDG